MLIVIVLGMGVLALAGCGPTTGTTGDTGAGQDTAAPGEGTDLTCTGTVDRSDAGRPGGLSAFLDQQFMKYRLVATVDGRQGEGWFTMTVTHLCCGVCRVDYAGEGPGIPGAPVYDASPFSGSFETNGGPLDQLLLGQGSALLTPLLLDWYSLLAGRTAWEEGATWDAGGGATVLLGAAETYAGVSGLSGEITLAGAETILFCISPGAPLPLYAKVTTEAGTFEYTLVEGENLYVAGTE